MRAFTYATSAATAGHRKTCSKTRLRACSGLIESGGFPLGNRCASLSALIRLWEAVDGEGIFRGYAPAGYRAGGKWCFTAGGSGTLRSEPQHGGDLGEVLSRDRPMCRQTAWWEYIAAGKTRGLFAGADRGGT